MAEHFRDPVLLPSRLPELCLASDLELQIARFNVRVCALTFFCGGRGWGLRVCVLSYSLSDSEEHLGAKCTAN